ncbi:alpha-2-macroglobulin-like [Aquarana catesbeiana]|uniref:alpha-2-macroglobulin-like n=1 Tax=Aquarana catesbeiana TaxID=8400 RepID=UPI003CC94329
MQLLIVFICLAICSSTLVSAKDPHYVITVPAEIIQSSQEKACVIFQNLDGDIHLKLELQKDDQVQVIAEQDINSRDFFHCYPVQVPALKESREAWLFHVSAQGEHLKINETKQIIIVKTRDVCTIQTDKETYKPGDIVKFHMLCMDQNFRASNKKHEIVEIQDPNNNRIGQWLDVTPDHGFADFTFHLSKELKLGQYRIYIDGEYSKYFAVAEYVLKRFELLINLPSNVVFTEKSFNLEVCGSYTYGKPVHGTLDAEVCYTMNQPDYSEYNYDYPEENELKKCSKITGTKTDSKGCLSKEIDLHYFNIKEQNRHIEIKASLTEDGTGHTEKATAKLYLSKSHEIKFVDTGEIYHRGHPFTGKITIVDGKKQPLANVSVVLQLLDHNDDIKTLMTVETSEDRLTHFALNTDFWKENVVLRALVRKGVKSSGAEVESEEDFEEFMNSDALLWISPFYSESNSLLKVETITDTLPCDSDQLVKVNYHINKDQMDSKIDHISFFYMVRSGFRSHIHKEYKLDVTKQSAPHGSFPIKIHIDGDVSPVFYVLVYTTLPKGETLSAHSTFRVSPCFKHKVQLKFSKEEILPGGKVNLEVLSDSGSLCSVRSVDKGYHLQFPYDYSFASHVVESLSRAESRNRNIILDFAHPECPENQIELVDRYTLTSASMFETCNIKIITNTLIKKPVKCVDNGVSARSSTMKKKSHHKDKAEGIRKRTTRKSFPDTWLFDLVLVGPEGHTTLNLTAPDSITKWETGAVCLGNSGIGEIRNVGLITFQPYFIELIMPYSVVQEETFQIEAQVFSYEKKCILVVVSLSDSDGMQTVQSKEQAKCVCDGHATYFSWNATASKPNEIKIHVDSGSLLVEGDCIENALLITGEHRTDSVEKTILVKARGHKKQTTQTQHVCSSDTAEKVTFTLKTPHRLVPGSEYAHIIVSGDLMANPVENLEDIIALPDGCAEQSISKFSRYASVLDYLQSINELTPKTKEELLERLVEGYQKQLTHEKEYYNYGFFYSDSPSVWITSSVIRGFSSARQFIYIDEKKILDSIKWLESKQLPNGCFNDPHSFNTEEEEVKNAAYILISLLEHPIVHNGSIVENAKSCIRKGADNATTPYTQALLAYAFTLLGDRELRALMLKRLEEQAEEDENGSNHWEGASYRHIHVETSAYVILTLLSDKIITKKDLNECADAIRWLLKRQNAWGGFYTSQDTTVALQALAKYAKASGHKKGNSTVTIDGDSGYHKEIHVEERNSLLLQTVNLPKVPGIYTVSIKGSGCVYIQSHLHYNVPSDDHEDHFSVNVTTQPAVCSDEAHTMFEVHLAVRYLGKRPKTNMVVIKVEHLSGHIPDRKSINKLEKWPDVERVDFSPGYIEIYLLSLNHETHSFAFATKKEMHVDNLHPANIIVYDYYSPEVIAYVEYKAPCSSGIEVAEVHDGNEVQ